MLGTMGADPNLKKLTTEFIGFWWQNRMKSLTALSFIYMKLKLTISFSAYNAGKGNLFILYT